MPAKATVSSAYRWRLGVIAIALLAFAGWFLYDGLVGYPKQQVVREAFAQIKTDHPDDWQTKWLERAQIEGWSTEQPDPPFSDWDIKAQFFYAAPCLVLGLIFGFSYLRAGGRWVASDESGLKTSAGQEVAWNQIESVDSSRWASKGIAVVNYKNNKGEGRITLDDWKCDTEATKQIYADITANTTGLIEQKPQPQETPSVVDENASA